MTTIGVKTLPPIQDYQEIMNNVLNETVYDKYDSLTGNILTDKLRNRYNNYTYTDIKTENGYVEQTTQLKLWSNIPSDIIRKYHREQSRLTSNAVKYISLLNFKRKKIIPSNELFYILYKLITIFDLTSVETNPCITYQEKLVIYNIIQNSSVLKDLFNCSGINVSNKVKKYNILATFFNQNIDRLYDYFNVNKSDRGLKKEITLMDEDVKSLCLFYNKQILHINKRKPKTILKKILGHEYKSEIPAFSNKYLQNRLLKKKKKWNIKFIITIIKTATF